MDSTEPSSSAHPPYAAREGFSAKPPPPRPMAAPLSFPPELLGRGLNAAEFFHTFLPVLATANTKGEGVAAAGVAAPADASGPPTAWEFMAALAGNDLDSFRCVCRHLKLLLTCLRTNRQAWATGFPPIKKRHILELVWKELAVIDPDSQGSSDVEAAIESVAGREYGQISVLHRLALFEGLQFAITELPAAQLWVPLARLEPLAIDFDGSRLWWLSCAPDRVIVELRATASTPGSWRCYDTPEALAALRLAANSGLADTLDRVIRINHSRQQGGSPPTTLQDGGNAGDAMPEAATDPVFEYLRAKFASRLVGCAELLHAQVPRVTSMSAHRLRHYLAGSACTRELADCLLQFERHLKPEMRLGMAWRGDVLLEGITASSLNLLLDDLLLGEWAPLAQHLDGRRGVCPSCSQPVTAGRAGQLAFCHVCCVNYHRQCAPAASSDGPVASTSGSDSFRGLWKCADCLYGKQRERAKPGVATRKRKNPARPSSNQSEAPPMQEQPQTLQPTEQQLSLEQLDFTAQGSSTPAPMAFGSPTAQSSRATPRLSGSLHGFGAAAAPSSNAAPMLSGSLHRDGVPTAPRNIGASRFPFSGAQTSQSNATVKEEEAEVGDAPGGTGQ